LSELGGLIQKVYEDKIIGKIPEPVCIGLIEKYRTEQETLAARIDELKSSLARQVRDEQDIEEFIRRIKKYADISELDRATALELIERIEIGDRDAEERYIGIFYKLLG
jgi:chromosome segregation ATPase